MTSEIQAIPPDAKTDVLSEPRGPESSAHIPGLPSAKPTTSPWLKEPSGRLMDLRSTPHLPGQADIVIVGSGITGAFAAHFLKEGWARDLSVVMLDAREACWGATSRNLGEFQPIVFGNSMEVAAFQLKNFGYTRDFVKENGIACEWRDSLGVHVAHEPIIGLATANVADIKSEFADTIGATVDTVAWASEALPDHGWDRDRIRETLAGLGAGDADGVILQPNAAVANPYKLVAWVLERLLDRFGPDKFALHTHTPVTRLSRGPTGEGWTLTTPRGDISSGRVLLATNAHTSLLLPEFEDLIVPVQYQGVALDGPPVPGLENRTYTFLNEGATHEERLAQRIGDDGAAQLLLVGGRHLAPDLGVGEWRDDGCLPEVEDYLVGFAERASGVNPGKGGQGAVGGQVTKDGVQGGPRPIHWTGIEGYSLDRLPWVGAVPEQLGGGSGLFLCAGYTLMGLSMAPICAKRIARDMMNIRGDPDEGPQAGPDATAVPACFGMDKSARVEVAREEWPDVYTTEGEGVETLVAMAVSHILQGRSPYVQDLGVDDIPRVFGGKDGIARVW